MDGNDKKNIKYVNLEEDQVNEAFNLTKILTITFCDSFSIFIILSLCCHEKAIAASSSKGVDSEDDEEFTLSKPVDFVTNKVDVIQPSQFAWAVNVDCATIYVFKQHNRMSLPISFYTLSNCTHTQNYFKKILWLYQSHVQSTLIVQKIPKSEDIVLNVNQMYDVSNRISLIINHIFFITKSSVCLSSHTSPMCATFTYMSSDLKCILSHKNCCILLLQESFDVDIGNNMSLKGVQYIDEQHFHRGDHNKCNLSTVSGTVT